MQQRNLLGALLLVVLSSWLQPSGAQAPNVATRETKAAEPTPAADWAVWRTFHSSLEFYNQSSADDVASLLRGRAGLTSAETEELLAAGKEYLDRLSTIDFETRQEIEVRYPSSIVDRRFVPSIPSERPPAAAIHPPVALILPKGESNAAARYKKLVAEGLIDRVDEERQAVLRSHLARLSGSLGEKKLATLKNWMSTDVAPKVKTGVLTAVQP